MWAGHKCEGKVHLRTDPCWEIQAVSSSTCNKANGNFQGGLRELSDSHKREESKNWTKWTSLSMTDTVWRIAIFHPKALGNKCLFYCIHIQVAMCSVLHRASTLCLEKCKVLLAFPCLEFDEAKVKCLHYLKNIHFSSVSSASLEWIVRPWFANLLGNVLWKAAHLQNSSSILQWELKNL